MRSDLISLLRELRESLIDDPDRIDIDVFKVVEVFPFVPQRILLELHTDFRVSITGLEQFPLLQIEMIFLPVFELFDDFQEMLKQQHFQVFSVVIGHQ